MEEMLDVVIELRGKIKCVGCGSNNPLSSCICCIVCSLVSKVIVGMEVLRKS